MYARDAEQLQHHRPKFGIADIRYAGTGARNGFGNISRGAANDCRWLADGAAGSPIYRAGREW